MLLGEGFSARHQWILSIQDRAQVMSASPQSQPGLRWTYREALACLGILSRIRHG